MSEKSIHFQGAGPLQVPAMKWAKEEGLKVYASDRNPYAVGLGFADEVLPTHESPHPKYCSWRTDPLTKGQMRALVSRDARIEQPAWVVGDLISKPNAGGSGSVGVQRLGGRIVEERVVGRHVDANGCFVDGQFYPCGLMEKEENEHHLPVRGWELGLELASRAFSDRVFLALERACRACGYDDGPVKGDFVYPPGEIHARGGRAVFPDAVLIEVSPRFHGDVSTVGALPWGSGINGPRFWFRWLARGEVDESLIRPRSSNVGAWRVIPPGVRPDDHVEGVSVVYVRDIAPCECHDKNTAGIQGHVCGWGETRCHALSRLAEACGEKSA